MLPMYCRPCGYKLVGLPAGPCIIQRTACAGSRRAITIARIQLAMSVRRLDDHFYAWSIRIVAFQSINGFGIVSQSVTLLLWPPALVVGLATGLLTWHARRIAARSSRLNLCAECGYSLTGLAPSAPCPECGVTLDAGERVKGPCPDL